MSGQYIYIIYTIICIINWHNDITRPLVRNLELLLKLLFTIVPTYFIINTKMHQVFYDHIFLKIIIVDFIPNIILGHLQKIINNWENALIKETKMFNVDKWLQ